MIQSTDSMKDRQCNTPVKAKAEYVPNMIIMEENKYIYSNEEESKGKI